MLTSLVCCLLIQANGDPKTDWHHFIAERRAEAAASKVIFEEVLAEAQLLGLAHADEPKSPWIERMRRLWDRAPVGALPLRAGLGAPSTPALGTAASDEREPNNTRGWADPLALGALQRGAIDGSFDSDLFAFDVLEDSVVDLVTGPGEVGGIDDTLLELSDEFGALVAFSDDVIGFFAAVSIPLPPGRYIARVRGYADSTGSYELSTAVSPADFADLAPDDSVGAAATSSAPIVPLRLVLPSSGHLTLSVNGLAGFDPVVSLGSPHGAAIALNDDAVGFDSQLRIDLSAGTYVIYVNGYQGMLGSFTVQTTFAPGPLLQPCGGGVVGTYTVPQQFVGMEIELTGAPLTELTLALSPAPPGSASDTIMALFDANWRFIATNDDSSGFFSTIHLNLPPGTYRALVQPFPLSTLGSFAVSADCSAPIEATPQECTQTSTLSLLAGGARAYRLEPGTWLPIEFRTDNGGFGEPLDPVAAVFSLDGALLDWNDDIDFDFNARVGALVPPEGAWVSVWGYNNAATGSTETFTSCPLGLFGIPALGAELQQLSLAKSGSYVVTLRGLLGPSLKLPLIDGILLLDPATMGATTEFFSPLSGSSLVTQVLPADPSWIGVLVGFQAVVLDPDRAHAWTSNREEAQL